MSKHNQNRGPIDSQQVARVVAASKNIKKPSIGGNSRLARFAVLAALVPVAGGIAAPAVQAAAPNPTTPVTPSGEAGPAKRRTVHQLEAIMTQQVEAGKQASYLNAVLHVKKTSESGGFGFSSPTTPNTGAVKYNGNPVERRDLRIPLVVDRTAIDPTQPVDPTQSTANLLFGYAETDGTVHLRSLKAGMSMSRGVNGKSSIFTGVLNPLTGDLSVGSNESIIHHAASLTTPGGPVKFHPKPPVPTLTV